MHLLFVCTGNICRSPLAERLTTAYAAEGGADRPVTAESAGTGALVGRGMDPDAALVLAGYGGSGGGFAARSLTGAHVDRADLVITMERAHIPKVLAQEPRGLRRTATLLELAAALSGWPGGEALEPAEVWEKLQQHRARGDRHAALDVPDPYRRGLQMHAQVGETIVGALIPVLRRISARSPRS